MNPTTCQSCGSADRIAHVGKQWLCAKCAPPVPCCKCGKPAKAIGVERFAVGRASDNAVYDLTQCMVYLCGAERPMHFTHGDGHKGPGTREPPQVYDALHVYVGGARAVDGREGMKSARKHRTVTLARSLCRVCAKTWEGANAQAVAARHTDATSHATRVEVNMVVEYGEEPEKQPGLFDGVMA